jgi:hypothetical protein
MSDTLQLLLGIDPAKIERPKKDVEITRLSKLAGAPVIFTIAALTFDEEEEIREIAKDDVTAQRIHTALKGVVSPNLRDPGLLSAYGAATPKELLESGKLLLPGEIMSLYVQISALAGYGDDAVTEIKNG